MVQHGINRCKRSKTSFDAKHDTVSWALLRYKTIVYRCITLDHSTHKKRRFVWALGMPTKKAVRVRVNALHVGSGQQKGMSLCDSNSVNADQYKQLLLTCF